MNTNKKLKNMVLLAVLIALIFLLGQTPLGLIPLGFCNVTILCIPVAVGTLLMGFKSGLALGLAFGLTSLVSAFIKPSVLVATLMAANPLLTIIMTILPRLCVPMVIYAMSRVLQKIRPALANGIAAALGSLTNTVLYLGLMLLFYVLCGIDNSTVLTTIAAVAGGAGPAEAAAAAIICPPIVAALKKIR